MENVGAFDRLIGGSSRLAVVSHTHPDGDAVGSVVAMASYAAARGVKSVTAILPDSTSPNIEFLAEEGRVKFADGLDRDLCFNAIAEADLIVICDLNALGRTGLLADAICAAKAHKVMVDHHPSPQSSDVDICISCTQTSSACELLYHVLMEMEDIAGKAGALPALTRKALLCGMTTDTNNFANSVFPSTLRMASELLDAGVDRDDILDKLYNCNRENRTRATARILSRMKILPGGVACLTVPNRLSRRFGLVRGELDGLVNMPLGIRDVRISILLKEENGGFRVSARAKRGSDVNRLCREHFNGGGHTLASGGRLEIKGPFAEARAIAYVRKVTENI